MNPEGDPDASMRRRILETVREYPGLHLRELARQLDTSVALVEYHVPFLEREGSVERVQEGHHHRLFPTGQELPRQALASLRDRRRLHIALVLLEQGLLSHGALAEATKMGKSTLSFHLRRMEAAGIVAATPEGYGLLEPQRVGRILRDNTPTPDLIDRFERLWGDLYG